MATKSIEIKCYWCRSWFNSPIFFGDLDSLDNSTLEENLAQCRYCNKMTPCNKENMRVRADEGGLLGNAT